MDSHPSTADPAAVPAAVFDSGGRRIVPEVMDQPGLDRALHRQALTALRRVNWLSRTADSLWPSIAALARELAKHREGAPLSLLDVACGGGDVALRLAQRAAWSGVPLEVAGCDLSSTAIEFACEQASRGEIAPPRFFTHDILNSPLPQQYDIVTCTLFLHHLEESQAVVLFDRLANAARRLVVISDLRRTRLGFWMAHLVSRVLTRSPVVRVDGPLSVAAALSLEEVAKLAARCGWSGCQLRRVWPERFLLTWNKS